MNENTSVICPVCKKTLESVFALDGHLRLTIDSEHIAFRQQRNDTGSDTVVPATSMIPHFAGEKLIDTLEAFVKDQEKLYEQETKSNAAFQQIKEMVEGERTIEKEYEQLIESEEAILEQERQKIRDEVNQQYQQDVDKAVTKATEELKVQHQKDLGAARTERINKEYSEGYNAGVLYIPNRLDGQTLPVQNNSPLHTYIVKLLEGAWVSHPEEYHKIFELQKLLFMEQQLKRYSDQ